MIYNGEEFYTSKRYDIDPIIDRVGGGDSFSGGIIHGLKPKQSSASSSLPIHTSTNCINGFMIDCAFSLVHSFLRKFKSTETVTP